MKILLSHSGKQHSYQVAKAMNELGVLDRFYTSSYVANKTLQTLFLKTNNNYFTRRFLIGLSGPQIDANWRFELKEIVFRKLYGKSIKTQNAVYDRDVQFDAYVAGQIEKRANKENLKGQVFWGFQGSCYNSLKAAKNAGMVTVIELATAHVVAAKRILGEEQDLQPEWADSIDNLYFPATYEQRLIAEPHLADYVVVASEFTKSTVLEVGILEAQILYLPLGVDVAAVEPKQDLTYNKPIKLLYAGTVTQRKGIKYLLEAMTSYDKSEIELHIYGHIQGNGDAFRAYESQVFYHGPVSQKELFNLYKNFDYLVLPSIFEGFGLVIVEAMAAGLPVITTTHTYGAELITHKENGFLVAIRSVSELREVFDEILLLNSQQYHILSTKAKDAITELTWDSYTSRLKLLLSSSGFFRAFNTTKSQI
ncbi:MAG: glycosyltransferase family 4 protein [Winogradskyella sp.]|nr:glycosyltransferase family 4 protein [Winogradskyella sp.]